MIYKYNTKRRSLKDFRDYRNSIEIFKNMRDGNINPKEVLKNLINFKLNLGRIRKGNPNFKSEEPISITQNDNSFYDLREKIIAFFRDYFLFCYPNLIQSKTWKRARSIKS